MSPINHNSVNRIIVIGASGVGKTTLVELLAPLLSLPVIPELARKMCKEEGHERIGDIPDQEGFKFKVLHAQIAEENKLDAYISDRSTVDSWALWQRWNICQAMTYDTERYYEIARKQAAQYSHIILVPAMFPAPEDGFRWTEPDYQKQIERLIRTTLFDWELWERTYVVQTDNQRSRVDEVIAWLRKKSKEPTEQSATED